MIALDAIKCCKQKCTLSYLVFRPIMWHLLNDLAKSIATAMNVTRSFKMHSPD